MLSNYNLFNNGKVDELTSTFLKMKCYDLNIMEMYVAELLNYYSLMNYCQNISFSNDQYCCLGLYSVNTKELFINYKKIVESLKSVSIDNYFVASNACRIILHEIKHILQHKMVENENTQMFRLFQHEFFNGSKCFVAPSEVNADIESSLVVLKNYDKNHYLYEKQLAFTISLINSFYVPTCIVSKYCMENKIQLPDIDLFNQFIYGLDNKLIDYKDKSLNMK